MPDSLNWLSYRHRTEVPTEIADILDGEQCRHLFVPLCCGPRHPVRTDGSLAANQSYVTLLSRFSLLWEALPALSGSVVATWRRNDNSGSSERPLEGLLLLLPWKQNGPEGALMMSATLM